MVTRRSAQAEVDSELLEKVGSNLKAERARRNLTQEAVARLSDLSATQVARMERGENDSGISKYVRVAAAIGMRPADLFFDVDGVGRGGS